ncbi:hypothetical protein LTR37_015202 [Vermiconidia calcicola]|uniref:Uncharacterized protein n=1 Tax=Vermiconidia calcicola TaxID=1690605 RepID=A0ACC3MSG8_9PEZI|nr:hypothetical protein LTR37_015202 [Vermiconidia calcicola]
MHTDEYPLSPPSLEELVDVIRPALDANFTSSSVSVAPCPDLRQAPYHLAAQGLSGRECIADIGGQPNLFPEPRLDVKYSMTSCARHMGMSQERGMMIGAGAGPWFQLNTNAELAPNFSWQGAFDDVTNQTYFTKVSEENGEPICERSPSTDCALMMNLYASAGVSGPVLKITARGRKGNEKSFTDCIRRALKKKYGDDRPISLGGVFVIKTGKANFHVMPDFPSKPADQQYTFTTAKQLNDWLTYHNFDSTPDSPIVCLTVFHSVDPNKRMGLRMEHTHCFTTDGSNRGGHYHYDLEGKDVEYEAYFNTAKVIYRIDKPEVTLERDLHD